MEIELHNTRLKYENNVLWRWKDKAGDKPYKIPRWTETNLKPNKGGYIYINIAKHRYSYHRIVYKIHNPEWDLTDNSKNNEIDHICRNHPLDNRIENLRNVTHAENMKNITAKGYYFHKQAGKWRAGISINGKHKHLGLFNTPEEAREYYLKAKAEHHIINIIT